jgi:hypothetical protein
VVTVDASETAIANLSSFCVANGIGNVRPVVASVFDAETIGSADYVPRRRRSRARSPPPRFRSVVWHPPTMRLKRELAKARAWLYERRLPTVVTLTDFDRDGVNFEITNMVECHRVIHHGDESEYTRAMLDALRPDDVLFDIGASVGLVSLHAARRCRTVSFEPDPGFAARLATNIALNPTLVRTSSTSRLATMTASSPSIRAGRPGTRRALFASGTRRRL